MDNQSQASRQWTTIQAHLLEQKAQINQAIREYPLPITACDDQFNYLLEKRSLIAQELGRFKRICMEAENGEAENGGTENEALAAFVASSHFISQDAVTSTITQ